MTTGRPTKVSGQGQRARDVWITIDVNLPAVVGAVVLAMCVIVALVVGWVV